MEDKFFSLCFTLLIIYLILFLFAKIIFALFGGSKKEKKSKKGKPPKTPFSDKKEVQQDLISLEQLAEEEKREEVNTFVYLSDDLPENMRFHPESFNDKKEEPVLAEPDNSINKYLDETKDNARKDLLRRRREEFLKEMNNPLSKYEKPRVDNSQDDLSSMILKDGSNGFIQGDPRSYERYRQDRMNVARENLRRMRELEGEERVRRTPLSRNRKWDYDEVEELLDEMEAKKERNELTLKDEFNNLSRDMKIFVLAKMINSDFKS